MDFIIYLLDFLWPNGLFLLFMGGVVGWFLHNYLEFGDILALEGWRVRYYDKEHDKTGNGIFSRVLPKWEAINLMAIFDDAVYMFPVGRSIFKNQIVDELSQESKQMIARFKEKYMKEFNLDKPKKKKKSKRYIRNELIAKAIVWATFWKRKNRRKTRRKKMAKSTQRRSKMGRKTPI